MLGSAWWGLYPPFEDSWTTAWPDKEVRYEIKLPELYTKDDLDKKYREGVAAGKAEMEEKLAAEYDRGYGDAIDEFVGDDDDDEDCLSYDLQAYSDGYDTACDNITEFLRAVWDAEGKAFEAIRRVYMERNPDEDEDEVCIEDIMEDIIDADVPIDEMMLQYGCPQHKKEEVKLQPMDVVVAPDGSYVLIHTIDDGNYVGFDLNHGKRVSGAISSAKRVGRMYAEED